MVLRKEARGIAAGRRGRGLRDGQAYVKGCGSVGSWVGALVEASLIVSPLVGVSCR